MFFKNNTDWNLLAKYMAGETNAEENASVETWLNAKPSNRMLFQQIKSDWEKMDMMNGRYDVDSAWDKLHNRIVTGNSEAFIAGNKSDQLKLRRFLTPMRIAASLLFLAVIGAALFSVGSRIRNVNTFTTQNEKGKVVNLPDGSIVYLNANTRLSYSKQFGLKNREIKLDGEAFFEVTPDKSKPFRIIAGDANIKVLGTSFNVNMRKRIDQVEVYVSTGVVELSEKGNESNRVLLHPGNIGLIDKNQISLSKAENENCLAWKTGTLTFNDTPLAKAISLLGDYYHVHMVMKGEGIDTVKINGSYQDDTLDSILQIIGKHNPQLTIAKSADTIYLSQE